MTVAATTDATARGSQRRHGSRPALGGAVDVGSVVAADWLTLIARAAESNVFFDPDFALPAASALGRSVELVAAWGTNSRLAALAPVSRVRVGRLAPALVVAAHEYGPLGTPLLAADQLDAAAARLVSGLLGEAGQRRAVVIPYLPADGPVIAAIEGAVANAGRRSTRLDGLQRAMLDRDVEGTDPRAWLPTKRRKEYARQMRRMHDGAPVSLEVALRPSEVNAQFEAFLKLEAAGWKGRKGSAMKALPAVAGFARRAVASLAESGRCRILTLKAGDAPAAILVCFVAGDTATTWKIAHDERLARFSPGAQLMLDAPAILFADPAVRRINSCAAPNHPMIDHLWPGRLALTTLVIAPERGRALHRAGLFLHAAERRARGMVRALRDRKGGHRSEVPS